MPDIEKILPQFVKDGDFTYIEPFVGSGAVLFWILNNFPHIKKAVINDINFELINTYKTIVSSPKQLISILDILQNEFHQIEIMKRKKYITITKENNIIRENQLK